MIDFMFKEFMSELFVRLKEAKQEVLNELVNTVSSGLQGNEKGGDC